MRNNKSPKVKLSDGAVRLILETAIRHVFEGNFKCKVMSMEGVSAGELNHENPENMLTPYVRISGDFLGTICMQMPKALTREIALDTLGFEAFKEEMFAGESILRDASGEIVNMMAGTFKNTLSKVKMICRLSPPMQFDSERQLIQRMMAAKNQWVINLRAREHICQVMLFT